MFTRPIVFQYGICDQVRVDHGKEWYLLLATQEKLSSLRHNQNHPPHLQTTSRMVSIQFTITFCHLCISISTVRLILIDKKRLLEK